MPKGDVIPCSFMIAQYAQSEHSEETIALFCKMRQGLVLPNQITLASLLQAFASLVDLQFGKQIHYHIVKVGLDTNVFVFKCSNGHACKMWKNGELNATVCGISKLY
jgi:hypothetical protein